MRCTICSSSESPSLLDMRGVFFMVKDQRMALLSCYNACKQIKIENEQNAKICETCQPKLIAEYLSKVVKSEAGITNQQSTNPIQEVKEEPELNIGSECEYENVTISDPEVKNEGAVPKTESTTDKAMSSHQIMFPVQEVKAEPELQIDEEESAESVTTGAGVATGNNMSTTTSAPSTTSCRTSTQKKQLAHFRNDIATKLDDNIYKLDTKKPFGKSVAWDFFVYILDHNGDRIPNMYCCLNCKYVVKQQNNSTSIFLKHACVKKRKLDEDATLIKVDAKMKRTSEVVFTEWFLEDGQSFAAVDGNSFMKVANFLIEAGHKYGTKIDLKHLIPDQQTLLKNISKIKDVHDENLIVDLKKYASDGCGATVDLWRENFNSTVYVGVTLSYIKDKELVNCALGVKSTDNDDSSSILMKAEDIFNAYGIEDFRNQVTMVTESDPEKLIAFEKMSDSICIPHLIGDVISSAMITSETVNALLKNVRDIYKCILKPDAQQELSLNTVCSTKWLLNFKMIDTICDNFSTLDDDIRDSGQHNLKFDFEEAEILKLRDFLKHVYDSSSSLEDSCYPTVHMIHPQIDLIKRFCAAGSKDYPMMKDFKLQVLSGINTTISPNLKIHHNAAIFLFPPTNQLKTLTDEAKEATYDFIRNKMKKFTTSIADPFIEIPEESEPKSCPKTSNRHFVSDIIYKNYIAANSSSLDPVEAELNNYMKEKFTNLPDDFELLAWWYARKLEYPLLFKVSKSILAIPAACAASKRLLFKGRRLFVGDNSPESINQHLIVSSNLQTDLLQAIIESVIPE